MFLQLRKEYEEKLKEEERLRQEQVRQEQAAAASDTKRKGFHKSTKLGQRIKSNDRKNYETLAITPGGEASDSENEIAEEPEELEEPKERVLEVQNMDEFYNDQCRKGGGT